jgi:hypothetical protein
MLAVRNIMMVAALALLGASAAHAQTAARELTLDVRPWSFDAAMAWRVSPGHLLGISLGGGADDLNRTFVPRATATDSEFVTLEQIVRFGPFYRYERDGRVSVDLGFRAALGGVRGISGSPGLVTGVQAGVFYGGRWIRAGPRLFVGTAREAGATEPVVHVDWLTARLRLPF